MKRRPWKLALTALLALGLSAGLIWIPSWRATGLTALFAAGPESVRAWALDELVALKDEPAALPGLALAIEDPSLALNIKAAEALYAIGPAAAPAWPVLARRLAAPDLVIALEPPSSQRRQATALQRKRERDSPERLRCTLAADLARSGAPAAGARAALGDELRRVYEGVEPLTLRPHRRRRFQRLFEGPIQPCLELCRHKIYTLALLGPEPELAAPLACHILDGEGEEDRATAAYALARIGPAARSQLPLLRSLLLKEEALKLKELSRLRRRGEPPEMVSERAMIAYALWSLGGEEALARRELVAIRDRDGANRSALARWALDQMAGASGLSRARSRPQRP